MATALAEWTTERPDVPGFYWWMGPTRSPEVVDLQCVQEDDGEPDEWFWNVAGSEAAFYEPIAGALWWPVRLDPPPVG